MFACLAPLLLVAGAAPPETASPAKDETCKVEPRKPMASATHFYPADADASAAVDAALADAAKGQRIALIVFGADWCHDSRALARVLTGDAFKAEFAERYSVTFIDVGKPQTGEGRNLEQIARFGVKRLKSTPAMFAVGAKGKAINGKKDALSWRSADSRGDAAVLAWLRGLAKR
ncbi:thioredoxin family protein [Novosphingobium sp. B 225]|uniref:thioredoxin family protein n=1 Tax=Novosphingobium sp. B 225 TaxID=1961849 RepID=UPI000B4A94AE|nr:thioredoxin family protein [Novosphingobium sp. B 225]